MQRSKKSALTQSFALSLILLCLFVSGCGSGSSASTPMAGAQLRGTVHGGQQPVTGSSIQLYAAGTSGYGTGATTLLSAPVTTDSTGSFAITGQYTCPSASSQLYIVATGGNPGLSTPTNNGSLALMAALGPCSLHNNQYTLDPNAFININEVTTVASVYSLAAFMDPISSQIGASASNLVGIANAFQTVPNLVNIATGQSLATTPAGNGTVPQTTINTLANILSACVNSTGSGPECTNLFAATTPSGGSAPTTTLQAIVNIATNPANQVAALYALTPPTPPFQPTLAAAPNDWTLTLNFTGNLRNPDALAIDASGNIWIANVGDSTGTAFVAEFANNGAILSGPGFTGGGISRGNPSGLDAHIAIDPTGNVWVGGVGNGLVKLSSNGTVLSGANGYSITGGYLGTVALDGAGDAWVLGSSSISTGPALFKFGNDGTLLSGAQGFTAGGMSSPNSEAIDASGNVWITNYDNYNITEFSNNGQVLSGTTGFPGGGLSRDPYQISIDAGGTIWILNDQSNLVTLSNAGVALSSNTGFRTCDIPFPPPPVLSPFPVCEVYLAPYAIAGLGTPPAIDGEGNVWVPFSYGIVTPVTPPSLNTTSDYYGFAKISKSGTILSGPTGYSATESFLPFSIGIDGSGNIWSIDKSTGIVEELIGVAAPVVTPLSLAVKNNALGIRP